MTASEPGRLDDGSLGALLRGARLIFDKDWTIERRSREVAFSMLTFSLLATLVFALGFYVDDDKVRAYVPGILWVVVLFAGTLGLGRLFDSERESDCLGGLLLSPLEPRALYLGKLLVQLVFVGAMELCTLPVLFLFFDVFQLLDARSATWLTLVIVLGTIGFSIVGTLFAALLLDVRMREVLLPIVVYPLVTPVFIEGVSATRALLSDPRADVLDWVMLMAAFDCIYLGLAVALFPKLVRG